MSIQEEFIGSATYKENAFQFHETEQVHETAYVTELYAIGMTYAATPHRGLNEWPIPEGRSERPRTVSEDGLRVAGSRRDQEKFFAEAYERGFGRTVAILRRRGANPDMAFDAAQAAWCKAWEHLDSIRDARCICSWVNTTAGNLLSDEALKNSRFGPLPAGGFEPRVAPSVSLVAIDLDRALKTIPARQRELLNAVYVEGQSGDQVAMSLGIASAAAVHHRLSRLRARLRRKLARA